ncbi:MAG: dockerin type I repeat-containing protein [bacterium]
MRPVQVTSLAIGLLLLYGATLPATAQIFPFPYEYSFSSAGAATVQIDFDMPDSLIADPTLFHQVIYRDQNLTTWATATLTPLYVECGAQTISGQIGFVPASGTMEWYLRSENDTAVVSQSPQNSANTFPPPAYLQADLGADPTGDAQSAAGNWLDLTHCYGTYSDTRLYFRIENVGGGFPTNQGLFTYFVYGVGVLDPDASDSSAYMLLYASVPAIFSPGLYKLNLEDSSFTQIGSISTNINGTSLSMACNISDLTSQSGWSEWPPPSGFIGVLPATGTQTLTALTINDLGKAAVFQPKSNLLDYNVNSGPALSDPLAVDNDSGVVSLSVTYTDTDLNCPTLRWLHWESEDYLMTACEKSYETGAAFTAAVEVSETGWFSYWFEFSDGVLTATTDLDSVYVEIQSYLPGDANGDEIVNITDAVFLISYIFSEGPAPDPLAAGDANCDEVVNITDAVYLIEYIFNEGPAPCA